MKGADEVFEMLCLVGFLCLIPVLFSAMVLGVIEIWRLILA